MAREKIIKTAKEFDALVDAYVDKCRANEEPVILTGLILALGLKSRVSLDRYAKEHKGFDGCVSRAKLLVESEYEKKLATHGNSGSIFALKNFGWRDTQEVNQTTTVTEIKRTIVDPKHSDS